MPAQSVTISLPRAHAVSGVTAWATRLAQALAARRTNINLVIHDDDEHYRKLDHSTLLKTENLNVVTAPSLTNPAHWHACLNCYRNLLPTVLLPNLLAESFGVAAALATSLPEQLRVIAWLHSDNPYDYACLSYYAPLIESFVPVSQQCAHTLAARLPSRKRDIHRLPHGIPEISHAQRYALPGRPLRITYAGRLVQDVKRVFDLAALATELDRRGIFFELRAVGDGPQADELRKRLSAAQSAFQNAQNKATVEPAVPPEQIGDIWAWADVSVLTSDFEGFSISMAESMMAGCVPVVSRVDSGANEVIRERETGLTFPVGDIAAMAEQITWLTADPKRLPALSTAARNAIADYCGERNYIAKVKHLIDAAASAPPRPWPPDRPLLMNSTHSAGGTVPDDASARLARVLSEIAQHDAGPIAIYGSGHHTVALAETWTRSTTPIVAVIDDDPSRHGRSLWGWPVGDIKHAAERGARDVIISSWLHENAIIKRRQGELAAANLTIHRLYQADHSST